MTFYTDVIQHDARYNSPNAIRDPLLLFPPFRKMVYDLIDALGMRQQDFRITETYRSAVRQHELYLHHLTQLDKVGVHHFGLACDLLRFAGGKIVANNPDKTYALYGQLAEAKGLVWLGPVMGDWGHIQFIRISDQDRLFNGSWYPPDNYLGECSNAQ